MALYKASDFIGCMSPANVEFVLQHNSFVDPQTIEVAPNSIELAEQVSLSDEEKQAMRNKYQIPINKPVFIYGGNLGKPQGIPFLIECLEANKNREDCHFLIVGSGTEYGKLKEWFDSSNSQSVSLYQRLPKSDYDKLVQCCDVGLIFLDHRFTIPNFPSRLLSYLEYKMPVICATDPNTDMGRIAEENGFGYWCESNSVEAFNSMLDRMINSNMSAMGEAGFRYLSSNFLVENTYGAIIKHF